MLTNRMAQQHDLSTQAVLDRFAQEEILKRSPLNINADLAAMDGDDARALRHQDSKACVDFWNDISDHSGVVRSMFNHLYGSMAFGLVNIKLQI